MPVALIASRALSGLAATSVRVEVHLANGLPAFNLVGLADAEVRESRDRVRAAIQNSEFEFPTRRITVNLAPADLPKESGRFDLPIAIGILAAAGHLPTTHWPGLEFAGELSLTGDLNPIPGALALGLAIAQENHTLSQQAHQSPAPSLTKLILPELSAAQAARVPGVHAYAASSLAAVIAHLKGTTALSLAQALPWENIPHIADLADVRGQSAARRALEVSAAGQHSLLMVGPPGTGKSMLAQRLPGLLPPMQTHEALEAAAIASIHHHGHLNAPFGQRPFRSPHHSASAVALVGGGSRPRPGEISLAHHGVLFLDELPEFGRTTLESLREPIETGRVVIARATQRAEYPAQFQLVAAMNPCPCGYLGDQKRVCSCSTERIERYRARISGPILDRIDVQVEVPSLESNWTEAPPGEASTIVRQRVQAARDRQLARQGKVNSQLTGNEIDTYCQTSPAARKVWKSAIEHLAWSARAAHRVLRVARSIADLADSPHIESPHIAEAIQYRRALTGSAQ